MKNGAGFDPNVEDVPIEIDHEESCDCDMCVLGRMEEFNDE